jgi:hypothetical protein
MTEIKDDPKKWVNERLKVGGDSVKFVLTRVEKIEPA